MVFTCEVVWVMGCCGPILVCNSMPTKLVTGRGYGIKGVMGYQEYGLRGVRLYLAPKGVAQFMIGNVPTFLGGHTGRLHLHAVGKMPKSTHRQFFLTLSCIAKSWTNFKFDLTDKLPRECGRVAISWILTASAT